MPDQDKPTEYRCPKCDFVAFRPNQLAGHLSGHARLEAGNRQIKETSAVNWPRIDDYPRDAEGWGPTVVVRCPESKAYPYGPTHFIARMEGGMWLTRDPCDPVCWNELHALPIAFKIVDGLLE